MYADWQDTLTRIVVSGGVATAGTAAVLISATAALSRPAANLGGYIVAQKVGATVGVTGPLLSIGIAAVGGPMVAGAVISVGLGFIIGGLIFVLCGLF
jgi:hypothetical protein